MLASSAKRPTSIEEMIPPELSSRLDKLDVFSRRVFAGKLQGERRSKRRGQSVEFADHRAYVPGDDLRRIDWNVFARLDRFFIKIFQEEEDLALHIVLDASASMDAGSATGSRRPRAEGAADGEEAGIGPGASPGFNKLLFAQRVAMSLGYIGLVNNNRVAAWVFDSHSLRRLQPARGRRHVRRFGQFLLGSLQEQTLPRDPATPPAGAGGFNAAMKSIARARTGRGVMVVLSDFFFHEGYEEGLRHLGAGVAGGGFDTWCLQVLSPGELDPGLESAAGLIGDLRFMDAETGRAAEVTVTADLIRRYRAAVDQYVSTLRSVCASRGMQHMLVPSDTPVQILLLEYLRRRGLLR
ncbi:MAG: DUF58 domain-containing protein [Phycisphaerales bacterium]|nr:DUF58 domain-containing protein [Phycisphaerales bacterium]